MRSQYCIFFAALFFLLPTMIAAEKPDFSGTYVLTGSKGSFKFKKDIVWTLSVVQTDASIEVIKVMDGKQNVNRFPLDGTEGAYMSSGGVAGKCKVQFKEKYLIWDISTTTHPQPGGPAVTMHTRERWELSPDLRKLTIHSDVDFPQFQRLPISVIEPWSEIYTRN